MMDGRTQIRTPISHPAIQPTLYVVIIKCICWHLTHGRAATSTQMKPGHMHSLSRAFASRIHNIYKWKRSTTKTKSSSPRWIHLSRRLKEKFALMLAQAYFEEKHHVC